MSWAPRPGDDKVQEAAATLASIGFDPKRVEELSLGEFGTVANGLVVLAERLTKQLSMRTLRLLTEFSKDTENMELCLRLMGSLVDERAVNKELRRYAERDSS